MSIRHFTTTMNGITIAYVMGLVNASLATLAAYGATLTPEEQASTIALVNAALILAVHVGHRVGEGVASGSAAASSQARSDELIADAGHKAEQAKAVAS